MDAGRAVTQRRGRLMPLHSLELLPDEAGRAAVLRDWQALRDAGLRSQLDHRGMTNTPHLTLVAAPVIDAEAERVAADALAALLPVPVRTSGLLLLGARKLTLARVVDVDDALVAAVLRIRAAVAAPQHPGWLPHLTLARRLPRAEAQRAVEVLGHEDLELTLTELRRWDPDAGDRSAGSRWAPDAHPGRRTPRRGGSPAGSSGQACFG